LKGKENELHNRKSHKRSLPSCILARLVWDDIAANPVESEESIHKLLLEIDSLKNCITECKLELKNREEKRK